MMWVGRQGIYECDCVVEAGHSQSVTCSSWSHSGKLLITSSDDKTALVWSLGVVDPIMTLSTAVHNMTAADSSDKVISVHSTAINSLTVHV